MDFCLLGLVQSTFMYFTSSNSHENLSGRYSCPRLTAVCVYSFSNETMK